MTEDIMRLADAYAILFVPGVGSVAMCEGARAALQAAVERLAKDAESWRQFSVERLEREAAMQRVSEFAQECEEIDRLREVLRKARWALGRAIDTTHSDISYAEISVAISAIDAELKGEV